MNLWQNLTLSKRIAAVQAAAIEKKIDDRAVEKDWWVTAVLKALFCLSCRDYLLFRGGTSISKSWPIIERFSEDIDLSLSRTFFLDVLKLPFAAASNNQQLMRLRKASRRYIHETLSAELNSHLTSIGISEFSIENLTMKDSSEGPVPIDSDSDPTVILVNYKSIFPEYNGDILPRVKIEISCLSMSGSFEIKPISTIINDRFPELDNELSANIRTVIPSHTFLEKAFLLNEELQKRQPRSHRMSRHLYDLERLMDTDYVKAALKDTELYKSIVEHRRKFYHLRYVNYDLDYPESIRFVPEGDILNAFKRDYNNNMVNGYIYGNAITFETLIDRLRILQQRFRKITLMK